MPVKYKCHFPKCNEYLKRHLINFHHLIPREIKKTKKTIPLCRNHHALIYYPDSKAGQHSINTPESIQILNILTSTAGKTLYYQDYSGKKFYYFFESKEIVED